MTDKLPLELACELARRYRDSVPERPAGAVAGLEEMHARLDRPTPEIGRPAADVIADLAEAAEPGLMTSVGSRFFGWVIGASHEAGVAADWLASAWGQNAGNHIAAPAAAQAEAVSARWLLDILRLPAHASVGFTTGATMANFACLAAARNAQLRRAGWDVEQDGLAGAPPLRVFIGEDAHATVFCALRYLGLGAAAARRIPTDAQGRMDAGLLAAGLSAASGPAIVIAQAGQINTGAFDPIQDIAAACAAAGAWLHVDGAFGLWARAEPSLAELAEGLELADSWATDGHKWLQLPYDCGFAIVRDAQAHRRAMGITASYLPSSDPLDFDPSQFVPELSRRARGFAAWAMLQTLGRAGIADMVRRHCALAQRLAARLAHVAEIEVMNEVVLNQVILAFGSGSPEARDARTRAVTARLQQDNVCFAGGATWHGRQVLRVSLISYPLVERDIDRLAEAIVGALEATRD
jgi:glutamate/tyrosine decarboxylase-like PLP-dependent enzyme